MRLIFSDALENGVTIIYKTLTRKQKVKVISFLIFLVAAEWAIVYFVFRWLHGLDAPYR